MIILAKTFFGLHLVYAAFSYPLGFGDCFHCADSKIHKNMAITQIWERSKQYNSKYNFFKNDQNTYSNNS